MPNFCFEGWTHAEADWSHKSAALKERHHAPTCACRPGSNICMLAVSMQPYFFGLGEFPLPDIPDGVNSICFRCGPHRSRKSSGIDYVADSRQGLEVPAQCIMEFALRYCQKWSPAGQL